MTGGTPSGNDRGHSGEQRESHKSTVLSPAGSSSTTSIEDGCFPPGTVLGGRYRIVARLGGGGMGEVFRADDLTLGVPVALKFLPAARSTDAGWLARLRHEVRVAREVAHPNVCRVYDIDEVDGEHFISMEYVDGDDLAVLLRCVGRLPEPKNAEIARQLCRGLAAAHDKGVVHRRPASADAVRGVRSLAVTQPATLRRSTTSGRSSLPRTQLRGERGMEERAAQPRWIAWAALANGLA